MGTQAPRGSTTGEPFTISPAASIIPAENAGVPNGLRRLQIERITAGSATVVLTLPDEDLDDNALIRIDDGKVDVIGTAVVQSGAFAGVQPFRNAEPGFTGRVQGCRRELRSSQSIGSSPRGPWRWLCRPAARLGAGAGVTCGPRREFRSGRSAVCAADLPRRGDLVGPTTGCAAGSCGIDAAEIPVAQPRRLDVWQHFVTDTLREVMRVLAAGRARTGVHWHPGQGGPGISA